MIMLENVKKINIRAKYFGANFIPFYMKMNLKYIMKL